MLHVAFRGVFLSLFRPNESGTMIQFSRPRKFPQKPAFHVNEMRTSPNPSASSQQTPNHKIIFGTYAQPRRAPLPQPIPEQPRVTVAELNHFPRAGLAFCIRPIEFSFEEANLEMTNPMIDSRCSVEHENVFVMTLATLLPVAPVVQLVPSKPSFRS